MRELSNGPITALVFDVMGTVVDDEGSVDRLGSQSLISADVAAPRASEIVADWKKRLHALMDAVIAGAEPWQSHRDLRGIALGEALAAAGIPDLPAVVQDEMTGVVHRYEPWPDSATALARLREKFVVAALTNADTAELAGFSQHGGLAWHAALSGETVRSFKPDPAVYQLAVRALSVPPTEILMVAAHPWDLRAGAAHGFATAYVARPGAIRPNSESEFDFTATDLHDLADQLLS